MPFSDEGADSWRVRLFPLPVPVPVVGLDAHGECEGVRAPDYSALDRVMLRERAGYRKRLHPSGVTEITASSEAGARALCEWVAAQIAASRML